MFQGFDLSKKTLQPKPQIKSVSSKDNFQPPSILIETWNYQPSKDNQNQIKGFLIALTILAIWAASFIYLLNLDISKVNPLVTGFAVLWQIFLYTGLFITAHDAMHGVVFPQNPKINHFIGSLTALIYGLFSYKNLLKKHYLHHRYPASELDPDFHDGKHKNWLSWYFHFMLEYWSWTRLIGLIAIFHAIQQLFHIPEINLILFWMIPPILSSVQLFYFGTFLTHREPEGGYQNENFAQSSSFPVFWSFITCYHFGYHEEHHQYPHLAWWQLPTARKT